MGFKKMVSWILCLAIALTVMVTPAWAAVRHDDGGISVQYVKTRRITANLTLQNGVATCKGKVYPLDGQDCSITGESLPSPPPFILHNQKRGGYL